jgi:hypothetical protein
MTDQELLAFNAKGFIPGPAETETEFLKRIEATQDVFAKQESIPRAHWDWVKHHLSELFGFEPGSLFAFYSNANLTPWQGAACWIDEDGAPQLQLREGFRTGHYLSLYSREETLAHEAVHAARAAFEEPENEEFFAYATSEKKWRRAFGPIFKNGWEAWVLIAALFVGVFWEWGILASFFLICLGMVRLTRQHVRRWRACNVLMKQEQNKSVVRAILFRLTDSEIRRLARGKLLVSDDSLRWRLLQLAYFSSTATIST